ncbi:alpha-2-macroglobulin family protein [Chitinophaga qingshengii]|uniref:Alpha-2-macroglobulin n=1 Tax=Chitinophaga qingshengii TaxID=1569794 RepID=A0ABR7TU21_9BACT|nr:alpha-2-macroglobulin family protein [Chitinophaga qingshengii]MBC9933932.1 alpha-2-macroglobulin [Chitinophaga qingshengii]
MAQTYYDNAWKKVTALEEKGLPKSAQEEADRIYAQAVKDKLSAQQLKALIYQMKYTDQVSDSSIQQNLEKINQKIAAAAGAQQAILQSIKGEILLNYLRNNRYRFYNRTAIAEEKAGPDLTSWSLDYLHSQITAAYQASLADKATLEKTPVGEFDPILVKGANTRRLRPVLFDLLAHRALDYYKSGENTLTKPVNQFELDDPAAFAPAATFARHEFTASDKSSLQYQAILLLQQLIRLHENDKAALLDVDLERIAYMQQISLAEDKTQQYRKALEQMATAYNSEKEVTGVLALLANTYIGNALYNSEKPDTTADLKKAKEICEQAIQKGPGTQGAVDCHNLLREIQSQALELVTEKVNIPSLPFRTLVKYKNTDKIYLRVLAVDETFMATLRAAQNDYRDRQNRYWQLLLGKKPLKAWEQTLPDPKDYKHHAAEIKIDALPAGHYIVLASTKSGFDLKENPMAVQFSWVSNISYLESNTRFVALDRSSGKPLAGTKLSAYSQEYQNGQEKWTLLQSTVTGADGSAELSAKNTNRSVRLKWERQGDMLFLDDYNYLYNYNTDNKAEKKSRLFLFTDRAIYRPGQTLYFKGIVLQHEAGKNTSTVVAGLKSTLTLYDVNNEKVDSIVVTSNEFGSFSGKFVLPEGRLNGIYSMRDSKNNGGQSFRVEEYKRPKFYVEFDTLKGSYRLGETVTAKAKALAYAGNNINGAIVKYRVERRTRYPYLWLFRGYLPTTASREIAHGETTTDENGHFTVNFPLLADKTVSPDHKPIFTYVVSADVTDLNGETRSAEQTINAGYQSLEISVGVPEKTEASALKKAYIATRNLNGTFEPASIKVALQPLEPGKRLLRPRYWEQADQFVISKAAYIKDFPADIYDNEDKQENWARKQAVWEQQLTSTANGEVAIDTKKLTPGYYELVVSATDKNGQPVVQKAVFELVDAKAKTLATPTYLWAYQPADSTEPGKKAAVLLGSSAQDLYVLQSLTRVNQSAQRSNFTLSGIKQLDYNATEEDRGGMLLQYVFVKDNRVFATREQINIPWDNKMLDIKIGTHRDKLLPGEKEKWSVEIAGSKGEKAATEMLASMYDASLDAFVPHHWSTPDIYPTIMPYGNNEYNGQNNFWMITSQYYFETDKQGLAAKEKSYDALDFFGWGMSENRVMYKRSLAGRAAGVAMSAAAPPSPAAPLAKDERMREVQSIDAKAVADKLEETPQKQDNAGNVALRKDFRETAFFLPELRTDKNGNVSFEFTMPEALTKWNFQGLAHTKDAAFGSVNASIVTQKQLMVVPNAPRFVRAGDKIDFTAKVSNLTDAQLIGQAHLELLDAATMQPVDGWFQNIFPVQHFTAKAGQSTVVTFQLQVPNNFTSALLYRVTAQSGNYSDGEENALPVLTNSILVTEALPLPVRGDGTHSFSFDKLAKSGESSTLRQQGITVEYTSNPAWYAVQALPYLMEYPYDCSEQVFNRYYANALATHIANTVPGIQKVFERWKTTDTAALLSNLQKNEELKSLLLQQTPWVLEAKNEAQQKKNIALLFDLQRMQRERKTALNQLASKQQSDGSFPWFNGMWSDRYITQYILAGIGHLQQLTAAKDPVAASIADKAMQYLDIQLDKDYHQLLKAKADLKKQQINAIQVQYLYARSFFDRPVPKEMQPAFDFYAAQQKAYWTKMGRYTQGMIALSQFKKGDKATPAAILKSLKENAINNPEMGMYWKDVVAGYGWHEAPIETQSLLIEAFEVAGKDNAAVADMKTWLLKNKQTNNWSTTKATADACYAMLLQGSNWLTANPEVTIRLGQETVSSKQQSTEAGTGYFKQQIEAKAVKPEMGNIKVTVKDSKGQPTWGAVYWQYFEELDKITSAKTPLVLEKELYKEVASDKGPVLTKIADGNELKVGDKVKVRIVLRADRTMEYIHLKDMRAACFEPQNVLSGAKWQNGLSYYESTKDASTDFFFSYLPKGTYVFEYALFVTHQGKFSNGISTAQCMYAPEFSAHSEGLNVKVVE